MSEPGGHLLEARDLSKYYGNVVALKDISAYVDAGEVTCVLGDNGAGKSSFIKILSGAHRPDDGQLLVDGQAVEFHSPAMPARSASRPSTRTSRWSRSCRSGATSSSAPSRRRASGR